jgi:hypothetical protein
LVSFFCTGLVSGVWRSLCFYFSLIDLLIISWT